MTTLDDHRIERMRTVVMDAVDADVHRRGRRTRIAVRTGAAVCAVAIVAGVGTQFANGGGEAAPSAGTSTGGLAHGRFPAADALGSGAAAAGAERLQAMPPTSSTPGRSIITTGSAHVVTSTPLKTSESFITWVDSRGGRIAGQSDHGVGSKARVTLTVRVPDADSAITRLRALGKVTRVATNARDVTARATDLDARIKETRISIHRLEAILGRTTTVRNVLIAERALTTRQQQLESMVQQRKTLSNQVALATLDVTFTPNPKHEARSSWFHNTFLGSLHAFGAVAVAVFDAFVYLLPWLVAAGLIALIWLGVGRLTRRRS